MKFLIASGMLPPPQASSCGPSQTWGAEVIPDRKQEEGDNLLKAPYTEQVPASCLQETMRPLVR